jgi:hypothetical protein
MLKAVQLEDALATQGSIVPVVAPIRAVSLNAIGLALRLGVRVRMAKEALRRSECDPCSDEKGDNDE